MFLGDNTLRVPTQELMCLLRRLFQRSGHALAMVLPSLGDLLGSAEIAEALERSHVLRIDLEAISHTSADLRGGSRNEILHGERSGNCAETVDDEVHILQCAPVNGATMLAQTRFYGETTCKCAAAKIIRQELLDHVRARFASLAFRKTENTANDSSGVYIPSKAVA